MTADVVLERLGGEGIACGALAKPRSRGLLAQIHGRRVVIVGPERGLGDLLACLVRRLPAGWRPVLGTMGMAWLHGDVRPGGMRLIALLPGRILRRIVRPSRA
jgi:phosphohistidine phosphatase